MKHKQASSCLEALQWEERESTTREGGVEEGVERLGWQRSPRVERDETNSSRTFSVPVDPAGRDTIFLRDDQKMGWVRR